MYEEIKQKLQGIIDKCTGDKEAALKTISEIVSFSGQVKVDMADVLTMLDGVKSFSATTLSAGIGESDRVKKIISQLNGRQNSANRIMINIVSSGEHPLRIQELSDIHNAMPENADMIWGQREADSTDKFEITFVLATTE